MHKVIATEANDILGELTEGLDFNLPEVDLSGIEFQLPGGANNGLYKEVTKLTHVALTDGSIEGSGAFDALMRGFKAHLKEEYDNNRITGGDYTKAYVELTAAAMAQASQFVLGAEQTFWQAITGQMQGIAARASIEVEKAKVLSARLEANNLKAAYALAVVKLATEEKNYDIASYNLDNILPTQLITMTEQAETARAQTMDTRLDGTTLVAGAVGKQKDLHNQQIVSYQRSDETKAAKIYADAFITMKTLDEGLTPPNEFTNAVFDTVFTKIRTLNDLN